MRITSLCVAFLVLLIYPMALRCQVDTLRVYESKGYYVSYQDKNVRTTIARFDLAGPAHIKELVLALGGMRDGAVRVRIFGNEGGLPGPLLRNDLIPPIMVTKKRPGIERIAVGIPDELLLTGDQFFVAVEPMGNGAYLLSDRIVKAPACVSTTEQFEYQIFEMQGGRLLYGRYGFVIDAIVEAVKSVPTVNFRAVAPELGIADTVPRARTIATEDFDGDGYIDLLIGGALFKNQGGSSFSDITTQAGLYGSPRANAFIDIDNDGDLDIVFMGSTTGEDPGMTIFENDGNGQFTERNSEVPGIDYPASFSIADADGDGYLDIAVGERIPDSTGRALHLLLNNRHKGFLNRSELLGDSSAALGNVSTVHWIDLDGDGLADLFVGNPIGIASLWLNNGNGSFEKVVGPAQRSPLPAYIVGSDWTDVDGDREADVMVSRAVTGTTYETIHDSAMGSYSIRADPEVETIRHPVDAVDVLHGQAGIATADIVLFQIILAPIPN